MLENKKMGRIVGVNGNLLTVEFDTSVTQNEVAYAVVGDSRLKCEVIRVRGSRADLQIFESSAGLKDGDAVLDVQQEIPNADFMFVTKTGMGLNCSDTFSEYKRMSGGIQGVDLYDDDEVVQVTQIDKEKDYDLVVATGIGTFKRVYLSTVNKLPRNRKGVKIADVSDSELQLAVESRTTKGKPIAALGSFRAKGVCSFRLNDKK